MNSNASFLAGCALGSASVLLGYWTGWLAWKRAMERQLQELRRQIDEAEQRERNLAAEAKARLRDSRSS